MSRVVVKSQAELDAALKAGASVIQIRSPEGVWLTVRDSGMARVQAWGTACVQAWGMARVEAWESACVQAWGMARVEAWESARVEAWESARVEAGESARVEARGSARVEARGTAHVVAGGSACVQAWGSARVQAGGSARVVARDTAHVEARDSAHVEARDSAHVEATPTVAVHLHSATATVKGGVVIDVSKPLLDPADWCAHHGVKVSRAGIATLYKAVSDTYASEWAGTYAPGSKPFAPDWADNNNCGNGLHFGPTPRHAREYNRRATKFLEVGVRLSELRPIPGGTAKCKSPRVVRACVEVDIDGNRIGAAK